MGMLLVSPAGLETGLGRITSLMSYSAGRMELQLFELDIPEIEDLFPIPHEVDAVLQENFGDLFNQIEAGKLRLDSALQGQQNDVLIDWLIQFTRDVREQKQRARQFGRLRHAREAKRHLKAIEDWFKANVETELTALEERARTALAEMVSQSQQETQLTNIPLQLSWEVTSVSLEAVDLEVLRPHLTPYAVTSAVKKHFSQTGEMLDGVEYEQVVPSAL